MSAPKDVVVPAIAVVLILTGLIVAGGSWYVGELAIKQKHEMVRRGWTLQRVLVASRNLPAGRVLAREDLEPRDLPEQFVTDSLFTDARQLEGKTLFVPINKGTPLHPVWFAARDCGGQP